MNERHLYGVISSLPLTLVITYEDGSHLDLDYIYKTSKIKTKIEHSFMDI